MVGQCTIPRNEEMVEIPVLSLVEQQQVEKAQKYISTIVERHSG